jgi:hypothetical protein
MPVQLAARPRRNANPIQQYALRLAFAELGAVDASLQPLSFERAMADPKWFLIIVERARRFEPAVAWR